MQQEDFAALSFIPRPERSEWQCHLVDGFVVIPNKGGEPNAFHRWMQRLAFGFRWEKRA